MIWAQWIATAILALGLVISWRTNSKNKSEEYGALKKDVEKINGDVTKINNKLDNEKYGLPAINDKLSGFETHCASVSSRLEERVSTNDKRLGRLEGLQNSKRRKG